MRNAYLFGEKARKLAETDKGQRIFSKTIKKPLTDCGYMIYNI